MQTADDYIDSIVEAEREKVPPVIRSKPVPDETLEGQKWPKFHGCSASPTSPAPPESILQEAHRLTHGPRQADYSHPLDDYGRTAGMVNSLFAHKFNQPLLPEDITMIMMCVKMSRQAHRQKRDNMVDAAGYAWCTDDIIEERKRREVKEAAK